MALRVNGLLTQRALLQAGYPLRHFLVWFKTLEEAERRGLLGTRGKEIWGVAHSEEDGELTKVLEGLETYYQIPLRGATRRVGLEIDEASLRYGPYAGYFGKIANYMKFSGVRITPIALESVKMKYFAEALQTVICVMEGDFQRGTLEEWVEEDQKLVKEHEVVFGRNGGLEYTGDDRQLFYDWRNAKDRAFIYEKALSILKYNPSKKRVMQAFKRSCSDREADMKTHIERDNLDLVIVGDVHAENLSKMYRDRMYVSFVRRGTPAIEKC